MAFVSCQDWRTRQAQNIEGLGSNQFFLFTNDYTPTDLSVLSNFTEPTDGAYARQNLGLGSTSYTAGVATDSIPTANFPPMGVDVTVYGYGVVTAGGTLVGAERFSSAPITIPAGDSFPLVFAYKIGPC